MKPDDFSNGLFGALQRQMNKNNFKSSLLTLLAASCLLCNSCMTSPDVDDTSPPTVTLKFRTDSALWSTVLDSDLSLTLPDSVPELHLWAVGQDTGGIQETSISGEGTSMCKRNGRISYDASIDIYRVNLEGTGGGRTESKRSAILTITRAEFEALCDDDDVETKEELTKVKELKITAQTINSAGLVEDSGTLTITWQ